MRREPRILLLVSVSVYGDRAKNGTKTNAATLIRTRRNLCATLCTDEIRQDLVTNFSRTQKSRLTVVGKFEGSVAHSAQILPRDKQVHIDTLCRSSLAFLCEMYALSLTPVLMLMFNGLTLEKRTFIGFEIEKCTCGLVETRIDGNTVAARALSCSTHCQKTA